MSAFRRTVASVAVATSMLGIAGVATTATAGAAATSSVGTRAQVPWSSVGTGWVAMSDDKAGKNHLVIVSPTGQPYEIATLAKDEYVVAVSPNGQHVATVFAITPGGLRSHIWDTKTGTITATITGGNSTVDFTKPAGLAVNVLTLNGMARYGLNGVKQVAYSTGRQIDSVSESPNGIYDAMNYYGASGVDLRLHSTGQVLHHYTVPKAGMTCEPGRWVSNTAFQEACFTNTSSSTITSEVYLQNVAGGAPRQLTYGTYPGDKINSGFLQVSSTSAGTYAVGTPNSDSGIVPLFGMSNGRTVNSFIAPLAADVKRDINISDVVGNYAVYSTFGNIRAMYDFASKKVNYIAGAHSIYGGEVSGSAIIGG